MKEFSFSEMQELQKKLQDHYKDIWEPVDTSTGARKLLWMIGEASEVGDILKKKGESAVMEDPQVRHDFVEEMADVLMYYNDVMICFGITEEELAGVYRAKMERNMSRWNKEKK